MSRSNKNCQPPAAKLLAPLMGCLLLLSLFGEWHARGNSVDWSATSAGGGVSTNGNSSITGTIGQPAIGTSGNGSVSLLGGFWAVADPAFTLLAINASANPSPPGSNVTFTVVLTNDADIQAPSGWVQFFIDGAAFGAPVALAGHTASLTTNSLSHAIHAVTAAYGGNDNFLTSSNQLIPSQSINTLPVAPGQSLGTVENGAATLPLAKLLARVTDADGDVVVLTNLSLTSAQGGTIALNGATITYTPPANFSGTDTFTYTVADTLGGLGSGTITVSVSNPDFGNGKSLTLQLLSGNVARLIVAGTTGKTYQLQYTDNLAPVNWQNLGAQFVMPSPGATVITDSSSSGSRYYRLELIP
jgi:hypothetical protein